ncbi:receptor like protein 7 [Actinidia rufa]|uniref:Receptor like protein 7 n=1 Tax=Actinidia rufa TaxID=165716 RepID=A0A7J0HDZ6_9ERIC|nr:receptor like protein 7 [Actinidia rufa]
MSWNESATDCCLWDGVTCDELTGHVIGLDLSCGQLYGTFDANSSLFQLPHLQRLNLAYNDFNSSRIPYAFGSFANLTHLNLSNSWFSGAIPSKISLLSKLISLDLSSDVVYLRLELHHFRMFLENLTQVQELVLNGVNISSVLPDSLTNLSSLTHLELEWTGLQGNIPNNIFHLPKLQRLVLGINEDLRGNLPKVNWSSSSSLNVLDLSLTSLSGELPHSFGYLKSLNYLGLNNCRLSRSITKWIGNLTQINYLFLSRNAFIGTIPSAISELQNLNMLSLSYNSLNGTIPSWLLNLPSLYYLNLRGNELTGQINEFPHKSPLEIIYLSGNKLYGPIPQSVSKLSNLSYLDLSSNNLSGVVELKMFSNLKLLKRLYLSNNNISIRSNINISFPSITSFMMSSCKIDEFPSFLRTSMNLDKLDLSNNKIHGTVPEWITGKTSLSYLNLSNNFLTSIERFPLGEKLENLDLHSNLLEGPLPIPPPSTRYFSISQNKLSGEIPSSICNAKVLVILDLSHNNFSSAIPSCLGNFSEFLSILNLKSNAFHGAIPLTFGKYSNLRNLDLNGNQFEGPVPPSLSNCKSLEVLDLGNNKINDSFPYWLGSLPELQVLVLRSNQFHGPIDSSKGKLPFPKLRIVDLSHNNFIGHLPGRYFQNFKAMKNTTMPNEKYMRTAFYHDSVTVTMKGLYIELVSILTVFTTIDLSCNKFSGEIPDAIGELIALHVLNLSHNTLTGHIPSRFGDLENPESLDLSSNQLVGKIPNNKLSGEIPSSICNAKFLYILDLSHNNFSSAIPPCLGNFSEFLSILNLKSNAFHGAIPLTFGKYNNLRNLDLNGNQFEGPVPPSLSNCKSLEVLDLGNNKINDSFPYWLGSLPELQVLVLRSNQFHGPIDSSKGKLPFPKLRIVDLSHNNFIGHLPGRYFQNFKAMKNTTIPNEKYMGTGYYQDSVTVTMKGLDIELVSILTIFTTIDLSCNKFGGEIPDVIGELIALNVLNLSHNTLTSHIPSRLGDLANLESLDLSSNQLVGKIPNQLTSLTFLEVLNLSQNHLDGRIPTGKQFDTFDNSSYAGKSGLCGLPLSKECGNNQPKVPPRVARQQEDDSDFASGFTWKVMVMGYGCGMALGLVMGYLMFLTGRPKFFVRIVESEVREMAKRLKRTRYRRVGRRN